MAGSRCLWLLLGSGIWSFGGFGGVGIWGLGLYDLWLLGLGLRIKGFWV